MRLPVEVTRFAWRDTRRRLGVLLPDARLREANGGPTTDEGHYILDCAVPRDAEAAELDLALKRIAGVVEHGLFLGMAERPARHARGRSRGAERLSALTARPRTASPAPPERSPGGRASRRISRPKLSAAVR